MKKLNLAFWVAKMKRALIKMNSGPFKFFSQFQQYELGNFYVKIVYVKNLEVQFSLITNYKLETYIVKQLSEMVVSLTRNEDYKLKDDTLLSPLIFQKILEGPEEVEKYFYKYKVKINLQRLLFNPSLVK